MTGSVRQPRLILRALKVAEADLQDIAGDLVVEKYFALLEQLRADPTRLEDLVEDYYGERDDSEAFTKLFGAQHLKGPLGKESGREVWRFKIWDLENAGLKFRFFYGYFPVANTVVILGVSERDQTTYDENSPRNKRVVSDYDRLYDHFAGIAKR